MTTGGLLALRSAIRKTAQEAIADMFSDNGGTPPVKEIEDVADRIENTIVEIIEEKATEQLDDLQDATMRAEEPVAPLDFSPSLTDEPEFEEPEEDMEPDFEEPEEDMEPDFEEPEEEPEDEEPEEGE